jgi:hypothetical protein
VPGCCEKSQNLTANATIAQPGDQKSIFGGKAIYSSQKNPFWLTIVPRLGIIWVIPGQINSIILGITAE